MPGKDLLHRMVFLDSRQSKIQPAVAEGQSFVIDTQTMPGGQVSGLHQHIASQLLDPQVGITNPGRV